MRLSSLTQRFAIWFVVVSLLPILVIGYALLSSFEIEVRKRAINHVASIADRKLGDVQGYLNQRTRDAALIAHGQTTARAMREFTEDFAQGGVTSKAYRRLDARYRNFFEYFARSAGYYDVFLISPEGDVVYSNLHEADFATNVLTGPYQGSGLGRITRQTLSTLQASISDFDYYEPSGGKIAAFIAVPLVIGGKIEGVMALQFDNALVWGVMTNNVGLGQSGETVVTRLYNNREALVVAPLKSDPDAMLKRKVPFSVQATRLGLMGQRGSGITIDYRGIPVVAAWRYLPQMGWSMVTKMDVSEALAPVYRMRLIALVVLGVTLLLAFLGAFLLARGIVNPLKKLSRAAEGFAAGNLDERVAITGRDEVAQLGQSFNSMAAELSAMAIRQQQAQKALQESNESLEHRVEERTATLTEVAEQLRREREFAEALIQSAPVIVLLLSSAGKIQLVNPYFERLTGYHLDEIRGKDWFDTFLPERDRERISGLFSKVNSGQSTRANLNPILTRNGEERLIEWSNGIVMNSENRETSVLSIGIDITESRALEKIILDASRHNQSLLRLIQEIEAAKTSSEVYQALRHEISATLGYSNTWVTLDSDAKDMVALQPDFIWSEIQNAPFLHELSKTDHVVVIEDMQNDPRVDQTTAAAFHNRTLVHVPMRLTGRSIGSLATGTIGDDGVRLPSPGEVDYLVAVAHHVAIVLDRIEFTRALSHSRERLKEAQRMARVGSWDLDLVSGRLNWSDEIFSIFEIDKELFGASYDYFLAIVYQDDREAVDAAYTRSVATRQPYQITHRLQMPDGRIKWVEERCRTWYGEDGKPLRSTGTVQDISDRIAAEEQLRRSLREKETLLREIHHRVKNNLQIISSLLYFQAKKVKNPDDMRVMADGRDRLRAMILVHEALYQSIDLSRVSFGGYIKTLVAQLAEAHAARRRGIGLRVEAGDYALPIETALPSGMIICELVINAFKYAFPDDRKGEVVVGITVKDGQFSISVADNGVGLPQDFAMETTESFGWQLINSLTVQLGGVITLGRGNGTNITISFPFQEVIQ